MTRMTLSLFAASRATTGNGRQAADMADTARVAAAADRLERRAGLTPIELAALEASSAPRTAASAA